MCFILLELCISQGLDTTPTVQHWCDAGYGGDPVAQCGADGQWKLGATKKCIYLGCGSLDTFLTINVSSTWKDAMVVRERLNFTSSDFGRAFR